ncbi:hypothetical protein GCM10009092_40030 [Bowmanella denitrificans]|uniref:Secreted protein n=1 Tax=Bowmanella denitrificans TaxID=366582 RepID=A0ABN0XSF4_9ALTE
MAAPAKACLGWALLHAKNTEYTNRICLPQRHRGHREEQEIFNLYILKIFAFSGEQLRASRRVRKEYSQPLCDLCDLCASVVIYKLVQVNVTTETQRHRDTEVTEKSKRLN